MPKLNEDSMYKPNGIWGTPFCKHCGKEAKREGVLLSTYIEMDRRIHDN